MSRHLFLLPIYIVISCCFTISTSVAAPLIEINKQSPAKYLGKSSCKGKYPGSFFNVLDGGCYSCPSYAPKRSLDPNIKSAKACKSANKSYTKATYRGKATGILKNKCDGSTFAHGVTGKCYSCPTGYKRTLAGINSPKACKIKRKKVYANAKYRGKPGCAKKAFKNGFADQCYSCPKGMIRNLKIGKRNLTKVGNACIALKINKPTILANPPKNLVNQARKMERRYQQLIRVAKQEIKRIKSAKKAGKSLKHYKPTKRVMNESNRYALKTISLGAAADGSYGLGANGTIEFAHSTKNWSGVKTLVTGAVTAGTPGADASVQIAFYTKNVNQLDGFAWAVELGAGAGYSGSIAAVFSFKNKPGTQHPEFLGIVVSGGVGAGIEGDIGVSLSAYL